jgi:hypothetical protein
MEQQQKAAAGEENVFFSIKMCFSQRLIKISNKENYENCFRSFQVYGVLSFLSASMMLSWIRLIICSSIIEEI